MKVLSAIAAAAMGAVGIVGLAPAPPAHADTCGNFFFQGNGGGNCDGPFYPDGGFQRCTTVFVLGIGGTNCFIVPPPPPPS